MINDLKKILLTEEQINEIVSRLGSQISEDYKEKKPLLIGLLKGCAPFMTDLLRKITIPCTQEYLRVSSYHGTESTGIVNVRGDIPEVKGKDIILVEDILDSGRTLKDVKRLFFDNGAKSIKICVFLDKPEGRVVDIHADYVGSTIQNEFVVGYGLDYNEYYRNLPFIGVLKEEIYKD
ncbi:MAG: hypoxanthine phosphoribosyltransferase [Anaeroplasma sp.]